MDLRSQTRPRPEIAPEVRRRRVLIADGNREWADGLAAVLEERGCSVQTVYEGHIAIAVARSFEPHIVILADCMPGLTGYETARVLARQQCTVRPLLVAVAGWPRESGRLDAQFAGFDRYLPKAGAPARILDLLDNAL